jgi:DNA-binding response OmpR family regulator
LVVDNDEAACEATTEIIESMGHHATCETASVKALSTFAQNRDGFDLAIIEPLMPEIAGLDLAIVLRRIRPGLPVLYYTGFLASSWRDRIDAHCPGRIAIKPLTSHELRDAIESVMANAPN